MILKYRLIIGVLVIAALILFYMVSSLFYKLIIFMMFGGLSLLFLQVKRPTDREVKYQILEYLVNDSHDAKQIYGWARANWVFVEFADFMRIIEELKRHGYIIGNTSDEDIECFALTREGRLHLRNMNGA